MVFVTNIARLVRASGKAYDRKWSFLAVFLLVFFASFSTLSALDIVPEAPAGAAADAASASLAAAPIEAVLVTPAEEPVRIEIPAIKLAATIANPASTDVATLDQALLSGAVRYPTSAPAGAEGNVIIFGHSSYLPVVNNKAFKAFNDIQKLKEGDRITLTGSGHAYVYAVESVVHADAESAAIPLSVSGSKLTLATCDSFGAKTDRFVVTADLVESYPLAS